MTRRRALITGVFGQDGRYLAEHLAAHGYEILGLVRREAPRPEELARLPSGILTVQACDLGQSQALMSALRDFAPHEVYNLASLTSGAGMYDDPVAIGEANGLAVARLLESIRAVDARIRLCQASSSELFGDPVESPQSERTPLAPRSPYGAAKLYAHALIGIYRRHHDMYCCSAILYNHESSRRRETFVTRKVTVAAARIKLGLATTLALGNLDARRDWGYAGDFVRAMHAMLAQSLPRDYVVATGVTHSVRELCEIAFGHLGLDYRDHVRSAEGDFRSNESLQLVGDASLAARELGWAPSIGFEDMIRSMVDDDVALLSSQIHPPTENH